MLLGGEFAGFDAKRYLWRLVGSCICSRAVLSGKEIPLKSMFGRRMLAGVVTAAGMLISSGCAHKQPYVPTVVEIPARSFTTAWTAELDSPNNPIEQMYVRDDYIFVYTHSRLVYVLSRTGGEILHGERVVTTPGSQILAPVVLKDRIVYPTTATLEVYDLHGKFIRSIDIGAPFRSGAIGVGSTVYVGTDTNNGGRVSGGGSGSAVQSGEMGIDDVRRFVGDAGAVSGIAVRRRGRWARVCGE